MTEQYDDPEYPLESLSAEDLANLLVEPGYSTEESSEVGEAPPDAEEAFLAALADLEDDIYRTGRRGSTTDVERTAARHGLSAREAARLELRAEDEGLVDAVEPRSNNPAALVETASLGSLDGWFQAASRFPLLTAEQETALARSYEAGRRATRELAERSVVDDDLRRKLTDSAARGQHARLLLICSNLRLVAAMTRAYHSEGLERVDLMQEGVVGLMRAVEKFDWRLGYKFGSSPASVGLGVAVGTCVPA